jgi:hypothetical protein
MIMNQRNVCLVAALLLVGFAATEAFAHGRGHRHSGARVGVFIGAPAFAWHYRPYYPYYYPPAYVVPAPVVVPATPPVYIERADESATARAGDYWYYCPDTRAYYPHVATCASPWQRVTPQPAPPPS